METKAKELKRSNMMLAFIAVISLVMVVGIVGFFILRPAEIIVQGQVEATEIRISGKVPGRILKLRVQAGQKVSKGDTLVILDNPEVQAKLVQAMAAQEAAQAQNRKAIKGARVEQIAGAYQMWQKSKAGLDIAEKSYQRVQNLFDKGVMSAQKRDEAYANFKAMLATEKAAKSQYDMAKNGAEKEDKEASEALVNRAKGAVAEVESYMLEAGLCSPIDGEVSEIFPQEGELVGAGAPIMSILDKSNAWVVFSLREDLLVDIKMGTQLTAYVPALDKNIELQVYAIKDMGTYAAWKATKTNGQYDMKTFEIKAKPLQQVPDLLPGMSVILKNKF